MSVQGDFAETMGTMGWGLLRGSATARQFWSLPKVHFLINLFMNKVQFLINFNPLLPHVYYHL
jgi:hypothetical protein